MRIDAHQYFLDHGRFTYPWLPPGESAVRENHLPDLLATVLRENRFDGSIAVQATADPGEADWLLELAAANQFILGVVAAVDLAGPGAGARLDELQRHPRFKAVLHQVSADVPDGLRELERRGIPCDLALEAIDLPRVVELAERFPEVTFIIDHMARPPAEFDAWARDMERLAPIPTVHVKLSGVMPWMRPHLFHLMRLLPPERMMFGSNWPLSKLAGANWKRALATFTQTHGPIPSPARAEMIGGTAARVYKL